MKFRYNNFTTHLFQKEQKDNRLSPSSTCVMNAKTKPLFVKLSHVIRIGNYRKFQGLYGGGGPQLSPTVKQKICVNVTKLKWQIIWTGRLPHLSGLPQLPRVPQLHVNRPLDLIVILTQDTFCIFRLCSEFSRVLYTAL